MSGHPDRLGLVAGYGSFPLELARAFKEAHIAVHAVAVHEETSPQIEALADSVCWLHVGQIGGMIRAFKQAGVSQVVMAGKVRKLHLFRNFEHLHWVVTGPSTRDAATGAWKGGDLDGAGDGTLGSEERLVL